MKQKKSTKKFLKNAAKTKLNEKPGASKGGPRKRTIVHEDLQEPESVEKFVKLKQPKGSKADTISSHKDELKGLAATDPEFYKFLQKNDTSLLDFGADDNESDDENDGEMDLDEGDMDSDSDDDDEEGYDSDAGMAEDQADNRASKKRIEITAEIVDETAAKVLKSEPLTELKKLLSMFRTACMPHGETDLVDGGRGDEDRAVSRYIIPSPEIYEKVMMTCISTVYQAFAKQLGVSSGVLSKAEIASLGDRPKWKKLQLLVVSYFKSIMHTLAGLAESSKMSGVALFLIDSLENYIPFLAPLPRLAKNVVKVLLELWSQQPNLIASTDPVPASTDKAAQLAVRAHAFLRIRQIAVQLPGAIAEECFRSMYLKAARQCKTFNELTASTVIFMIQSVTELYGTDLALAYQQSFLYIRQLALHLRAALLKKTEETTRQITSMQYLNCLRLWTRVVCTYPSTEDGLGALAFPLAQIMFGVITAVPSIYFTPLKFNLTTCLHQLAAACKIFIPTTAMVLEVLEHPDLVSKPTPSTDLTPKLDQLVRLPANSVLKAVVRDAIVSEAAQLIRQDAEIYRFHVGLPEYSYLTVRKLRAYLKKCKITKWRDILRNVTGQIEQYSTAAQQGRAALNKGPMSVTDFEPLLPHGSADSKGRLSKLISGGKGAAFDTSVLPSATAAKKTAVPKDLFASSYSAIKADQAKSARKKAAKGARGDDSDASDADNDAADSGDETVMSEEGEAGMDYGDESGSDFEVQSGSDDGDDSDSEGEQSDDEPAPAKKGKGSSAKDAKSSTKGNGKAVSAKAAPAKAAPAKAKKPRKPKFDYKGVDPNTLKDSVGDLNWDDDDE